MIYKPTTSEVMETFNKARDEAKALSQEILDTKEVLSDKLSLIDAQMEYMTSQINVIADKAGVVKDKIFFTDADKVGKYDQFGMTIHPKMAKDPRDLFNFRSTKGYMFKGNVSTYVNDTLDNDYLDCLKNDTVTGKKYFIKTYDQDTIKLSIRPNLKAPLGSLQFNMIELMPYLPGSFNIESIKVYSRDNLEMEAQAIEGGIIRVGNQRIVFSTKTEVGKVDINIRILYKNSAGKYPFGLRHLYMQEVDFENDCYVIVRADKAKAISYIYDDIVLKNQFGIDTAVSSKENGIQYYAAFDGEECDQELEVSKPASLNYIATNTKSVFIKVPVTTAMISMTPNLSTEALS